MRLLSLWEVLFPKQCPFCGKVIPGKARCCEGCEPALPWLKTPWDLPGLDGLFAPFSYEGAAENAVRQLKFQGKTGRARSLAPYLTDSLKGARFDCIVPVPMYRKGLRKRGYNQAALLARFLGEETGMPVCPALRKRRDTAQQHDLRARERRINLKDAYRVRKGVSLEGKSVLLCDDVVTTGSTLLEAAQTLRKAGAARVYAVTVCKTVRRADLPGEVG